MIEVKIIDAIMGSGKTYNAIERMKKTKGKFVYVTPFLNEVERVISNVPNCFQPKIRTDYNDSTGEKETIYKRDDLLKKAAGGVNLVTTHSLFKTLHKGNYNFFEDYDLILDEVLDPIKVLDMKPDDIKIALKQGLVISNPQTGEVTYTGDDYQGNFYRQLKDYCATSNVIYLNERLLVWAFPPEIFKCFKSVNVLTYLFEGSLLAAYFKYYSIPYQVIKDSKQTERKKKEDISKLLTIYEGTANDVGNRKTAFSVNWLKNKSNRGELQVISKSAVNLIKRKFKTKSKDNAYTTFKKFKGKLKGKGYTNGFIAVNERATNKYSDKQTMIYFANRFIKPEKKEFFIDGNIKVDEGQWALGELIQWIWRGRIRRNQPMNLFIPSKRMRNLLKDWLNS